MSTNEMSTKVLNQEEIKRKKQRELIFIPIFLLGGGFILSILIFPSGIDALAASLILAAFSIPIGLAAFSKTFPKKLRLYYIITFIIGLLPLISNFI